MSMESLALRKPHLHESLLLAQKIWDDKGMSTQPIEVFNADFDTLKRLGITHIGAHQITRGRVKSRRIRRPKEALL